MAQIKKVYYYTMGWSLFRGKVWKEYYGPLGAVPINTPQKLSYDRLAPGVLPPPKLTKEQIKIQKAEQAHQKALNDHQKKEQKAEPKKAEPKKAGSKQAESTKPIVLEAEDKETLPIFDLQDVPNAMDKLGFPVAAKAARKWFASPKHIYNDQTNSVQPIDDNIVTLKWALKFGSAQDKFNELMGVMIYSENVVAIAKKKNFE